MSRNLLIIEDEPTVQLILKHFLKNDYNVVTKSDGLEALEWLEDGNEVDMVISDLEMPNFNGYEVVEALRSSNIYKNIPIMILSANDSSNDRIRCLTMGVDDYVVKPFNPEEIKLRVNNILRRVNSVKMTA